MQLNPELQAIVDKLNNDRSVKATSTTVGPFDQISKDILSILIANYDLLSNKSGEDRAKTFVTAYEKLLKEKSNETSV